MVGGLMGIGIGTLADRHGPRLLLALPAALAGSAFALVSTVRELWQLYLLVGVLGGIGMSSFYLVAASTVVRWFADRRGLAIALVFVGFNLGYISSGPLAAWLIVELGWRAAYALLGGGCAVMTTLAALTVRLPRATDAVDSVAPARPAMSRGSSTLAGLTLRQALVAPRQWGINVSWLLLGGLMLMLTVHVVPFARDRGIDLAGASLALTGYGLGAVTGRVASGAVSDRFGIVATLRVGYVLQLVALMALVLVPSREVLFASLAVFGLGAAAADTMIMRTIPELFGLRALGAIMGVLTLGWRFGAALGPAAAGFIYDLTGSYVIPFGAAPVVVLISWAVFALSTARVAAEAAAGVGDVGARPERGWPGRVAPRPAQGERTLQRAQEVEQVLLGAFPQVVVVVDDLVGFRRAELAVPAALVRLDGVDEVVRAPVV